MGDMIYTLPLLHSLRRHFPKAHITVACDVAGEPIALACPAVNDVVLLAHGLESDPGLVQERRASAGLRLGHRGQGRIRRRLARLTRLTNAAIRIGFVRDREEGPSAYYTDAVELPAESRGGAPDRDDPAPAQAARHHAKMTAFAINLTLELPLSAREFAEEILSKAPFTTSSRYMLINISSTAKLKFREEDFISLCKRILNLTDLAIGLVAAPQDQQKAREIAMCMGSKRIDAIETPGAMELAALMTNAPFCSRPRAAPRTSPPR